MCLYILYVMYVDNFAYPLRVNILAPFQPSYVTIIPIFYFLFSYTTNNCIFINIYLLSLDFKIFILDIGFKTKIKYKFIQVL